MSESSCPGPLAPIDEAPGPFLEPAVDRAAARRQLARRRLDLLRRLAARLVLRRRRAQPAAGAAGAAVEAEHGVLPFLELVWLPCHRLTFETRTRRRRGAIDVLVGAVDGSFTLADLTGVDRRRGEPGAQCFESRLSVRDAVDVARRHLLRTLLRVPGGPRGSIGEPIAAERIEYPYWVRYVRGRGGALDFRMLDALTGEPVGQRTRIAFLDAITRGGARAGTKTGAETHTDAGAAGEERPR